MLKHESGWKLRARHGLVALLCLCVAQTVGCLDMTSTETAICVLIDVSGTYSDQKADVVKIVKREILPTLVPGDTFITILIDSESYEKDNVTVIATLDARPSRANAQKLALAQELDAFAASETRSRFTDIPGAMMLGAEYLQEARGDRRVMLVFSDLREELPKGAKRELRPDEFQGIEVVAMNVKRLGPDSADPAVYRRRLESWHERVEGSGGASWRTVMDANQLPEILEQLRS
jgi:hypothetical protein